MLWDEQTKWLREAYTPAGAYTALPLLAVERRPERWDQFLSCCEDPLPNPVLLALAERLDAKLPEEKGTQRYHLRSLARRLLDNGRDDLVRQLAAGSEHFAAMLGPLLAGRGDIESQLKLAGELSRTLRESGAPGPEDLDWLSGVESEQLLGALFAILEQNWKLDERPVAAVRSGTSSATSSTRYRTRSRGSVGARRSRAMTACSPVAGTSAGCAARAPGSPPPSCSPTGSDTVQAPPRLSACRSSTPRRVRMPSLAITQLRGSRR